MRRNERIVSVTTEQMIAVDRAMLDDYRIVLIQMMENAGRNLAHLARTRFLGGDPRGRRVTVLAGPGGNGGGALVAARRLWCWGANIRVFITAEDSSFAPVPAHQLDIVRRMEIPVGRAGDVGADDPELVIDGLIGYSLRGAPQGEAADLIRWANAHTAPVLSLDVPSGVDTTSGMVRDPAIAATATMTLALPKRGLSGAGAAAHVGELYLADISVPPSLYARPPFAMDVGPVFACEEIIRLK